MAVVNVKPDGNAPSGLSVGDTVKTAGGNYNIVSPGTVGAKYNPKSGYWSVKADDKVADFASSALGVSNYQMQNAIDAANRANAASASSSAAQYAFNSKEAQKNRDWQERMSNTAYQRQVKDLMAAGLNPVLGYMNSQGATTPSGAAASGANYHGAQPQVDLSGAEVYASILSSFINSATQKDIAELNASTAIQQASISSAAAVQSAGIGAAASRYGSDKAFEQALKTNSWQNILANRLLGSGTSESLLSRVWNAFINAYKGNEPERAKRNVKK